MKLILFCIPLFFVCCNSGVTTPLIDPPDSTGATSPDVLDTDNDGIVNSNDDCPGTPSGLVVTDAGCSLGQLDSDGDGFSDEEEILGTPGTNPLDPNDNPNNVRDTDGDGCSDFDETNFSGFCDNNPFSFTFDIDGDGVNDSDDNCLLLANPNQVDSNLDGIGDACTQVFDYDGDGVPDDEDNCVVVTNPDQLDSNGDGLGDACTLVFDSDGDGVNNEDDNCVITFNPSQADSDGDGVGDACEIVIPPSTLTIIGIYSHDILELSDGSVWETTYIFGTYWDVGDRVVVNFNTITNVDESVDVRVSYLGDAIAHSSVRGVRDLGQFVELLNGTIWEIDFIGSIDTKNWFIENIVVVKNGLSYLLINELYGHVVNATPL